MPNLILIVDDDDFVLESTARLLKALEFNVLCAHTPLQALDLVQNLPEPPALLLSDFQMPLMNGDELVIQLNHHFPTIKTIIMSGADLQQLNSSIPLEEGRNFIPKPFSLPALRKILQQALPSLSQPSPADPVSPLPSFLQAPGG